MASRFYIRSVRHLNTVHRLLTSLHSLPIKNSPTIASLLHFPCQSNSSPCLPTNPWTPFRLSSASHSSSEHSETPITCWSCGENISNKSNLTCPSCNAVQKPDPSIDYFQMFGVDRKYELDTKDLEGKYKNLMKKLHPDLFHGKSPEEQANSAHLASVVTKAYTELLKPVSRATYLLKLQGIHVEEEGTVNDPELIMEVMEIRETLEQTSDRKTLQQLCDKARMRMDEWVGSFTTAWKEGNVSAAIAALQRMSYFNRVFEDIRWKLL